MPGRSASKPLYVLTITKPNDASSTQVNRIGSDARAIPLYSATRKDKSYLEVKRAMGLAWNPNDGPVGTVAFRSISSRMNVTVRGVPFQMARSHPFASGHRFRFLGAGRMKWEEASLLGGGLSFVDAQGRELARYRSRLDGTFGSKEPGFEVFVPVADVDLDLLVTTGLAAVQYRRQSDEDLEEVIQTVLGV